MFTIENAQPHSAAIQFDSDGGDRAEIRRHGYKDTEEGSGFFYHPISPDFFTTDKEWQSMLDLINAAPDLLTALRAAVSVLTGWECTSRLDAADTETVRLCKAALAKAEGRAS